ncbi:MAG: NAD(P)-dependent oxidoreductase [Bacteroidota bacterium]
MNVIITGAFGFLGSYVVKQCANLGLNPIVLKRKDSDKERLENCEYVAFEYDDIENDDVIREVSKYNPQSLIHIAWKGIDSSTRNNEDQITYNLPFSITTIEFAKKVGCTQWIGIGSLSEYGKITEKVDENRCTSPSSLYAKSKLATCWASSALCQAYDMKWAWIRVGSIYGPGDADNWLIPYVINSILNGKTPELTLSEQVWDYLNVTDAANAVLQIVKSRAEGIFNLGSGNEITIKQLVELIDGKLNAAVRPKFGAKPYSLEQVMYMAADITKIKQTTGWEPQIGLSDGLDETILSFQKKNKQKVN